MALLRNCATSFSRGLNPNPQCQPIANTHHYTEYRAQQLVGGANGKTLNNRLGYLRSVFRELLQQGEIDYANPLIRVKPLKLQERELAYLNDEQITTLFEACSVHPNKRRVGATAKGALQRSQAVF